jgi:hypothetical protein
MKAYETHNNEYDRYINTSYEMIIIYTLDECNGDEKSNIGLRYIY